MPRTCISTWHAPCLELILALDPHLPVMFPLFSELGTAQDSKRECQKSIGKDFWKAQTHHPFIPSAYHLMIHSISHSHHSPVPHLVTLGLILNRIRLLMFFQVCWLVHDVFRPRHHGHHDTGATQTYHGIATRHPCASGINGMVPRSGRPLSWKALKDVKRI